METMTSKYQVSIPSLIGKRAVITLYGVLVVAPIEAGCMHVWDVFEQHKAAYPDRPCGLIYDGWIRCEYGRPMERIEIAEALASSGLI